MLSKAVAFYGCMALLLIVGANADTNDMQIVENCQERIDECKKIATTEEEIMLNQFDIRTCFASFECKDMEDDLRMKAMFDYRRTILMEGDENIPDDFVQKGPSNNLAVIISVSYETLIISSFSAIFLA